MWFLGGEYMVLVDWTLDVPVCMCDLSTWEEWWAMMHCEKNIRVCFFQRT